MKRGLISSLDEPSPPPRNLAHTGNPVTPARLLPQTLGPGSIRPQLGSFARSPLTFRIAVIFAECVRAAFSLDGGPTRIASSWSLSFNEIIVLAARTRAEATWARGTDKEEYARLIRTGVERYSLVVYSVLCPFKHLSVISKSISIFWNRVPHERK